MKRLLLFAFLLLTSISLFSQKDAKLKREFNRERNAAIEDGWDIVPFPGEHPTRVVPASRNNAAVINNWGEDLLLPDSIRTRLVTECKNKVVVKVFDTGGKCSHTKLTQGQRVGSVYTGEPTPEDGHGHSHHVAGIIVGDDGLGLLDGLVDAGLVTWKPVKVLNNAGSGSFSWIANAVVQEDTENRALLSSGTFVVVNMSLGGGTAKVQAIEDALKNSSSLGVFYCVAAGNTGTLGVNYPGNSQYVLGVGSLDQNLATSSYSTFGPEVWNAEPGRNIYSTYKGNAYATMSGTSMATPFQTGLVAIALSKWGSKIKDLATLRAYMAWVATDLPPTGKDNNTGYGYVLVKSILDKDPALTPGLPTNPPPPPPTDTIPTNPHPERNITFNFTGEFPVYWQWAGPGQIRNNFITRSQRAGFNKSTITRIEFRVNKSKLMAEAEYKRAKDGLSWYYVGNRGLGLADGSDYADAIYWNCYFFEMLADKQRGLDIDILRVEGKDDKGNTVVLDFSELRHWPIK